MLVGTGRRLLVTVKGEVVMLLFEIVIDDDAMNVCSGCYVVAKCE